MKKTIKKIRGFTIIELLVVIAIIAILTGIVLGGLNPAKAKARDAKRISDLGQIQLALELYFDRCKQYPSTTGSNPGLPNPAANNGGSCPGTITFTTFIATIPSSPSPGNYVYNRISDTDYTLYTSLENYNEALKDDFDSYTCGSDGGEDSGPENSELVYCLGPK